MAHSKKSFMIENPAMQFISAPDEATGTERERTDRASYPPTGYKVNPELIETKTKRLQLVLQPSLFAKIKETATAQGLSVNEYCHRVLAEATGKEV